MFSKKPGPAPRQDAAKAMSGATFSVIGADVAIIGNIAASADLHIDGRVEGDIKCSSLVQGDASTIVGGVAAGSVRLAGHVKGTIDARELVILRTARIEGDVHYDALTIEQGAQVEGRFAPRPANHESNEPVLTLAS